MEFKLAHYEYGRSWGQKPLPQLKGYSHKASAGWHPRPPTPCVRCQHKLQAAAISQHFCCPVTLCWTHQTVLDCGVTVVNRGCDIPLHLCQEMRFQEMTGRDAVNPGKSHEVPSCSSASLHCKLFFHLIIAMRCGCPWWKKKKIERARAWLFSTSVALLWLPLILRLLGQLPVAVWHCFAHWRCIL